MDEILTPEETGIPPEGGVPTVEEAEEVTDDTDESEEADEVVTGE